MTHGPQFVPARLVSIPDAARELGISESALWDVVWSGGIASVKLGRRRLIPRATIERLCADPGVSAEHADQGTPRRQLRAL